MKQRVSQCRSCGAPIIWATITPSGRTAPIDRDPHADGNVRFAAAGTVIVEVLDTDARARAVESGSLLHRSHFATCPNAKEHRRA